MEVVVAYSKITISLLSWTDSELRQISAELAVFSPRSEPLTSRSFIKTITVSGFSTYDASQLAPPTHGFLR